MTMISNIFKSNYIIELNFKCQIQHDKGGEGGEGGRTDEVGTGQVKEGREGGKIDIFASCNDK